MLKAIYNKHKGPQRSELSWEQRASRAYCRQWKISVGLSTWASSVPSIFYLHLSLSQVASVPDSWEWEVHPTSFHGQVAIPAWSVKGCIWRPPLKEFPTGDLLQQHFSLSPLPRWGTSSWATKNRSASEVQAVYYLLCCGLENQFAAPTCGTRWQFRNTVGPLLAIWPNFSLDHYILLT